MALKHHDRLCSAFVTNRAARTAACKRNLHGAFIANLEFQLRRVLLITSGIPASRDSTPRRE
jgi:hypothetical protein